MSVQNTKSLSALRLLSVWIQLVLNCMGFDLNQRKMKHLYARGIHAE